MFYVEPISTDTGGPRLDRLPVTWHELCLRDSKCLIIQSSTFEARGFSGVGCNERKMETFPPCASPPDEIDVRKQKNTNELSKALRVKDSGGQNGSNGLSSLLEVVCTIEHRLSCSPSIDRQVSYLTDREKTEEKKGPWDYCFPFCSRDNNRTRIPFLPMFWLYCVNHPVEVFICRKHASGVHCNIVCLRCLNVQKGTEMKTLNTNK